MSVELMHKQANLCILAMLLRSILVVDETNDYYSLWELIQKITWFHILLVRNKIFTITNH